MTNSRLLRRVFWLLPAMLSCPVCAQTCFDSGSTPIDEAWRVSPLALGCSFAPAWPMWTQFTPMHRTPAAHVGFRQGRAEAVPVLVVTFKCTELLLAPIAIAQVRTQGYVIDMPEVPCT